MILGPSGENIYPEEIENVINGHALVADSLVKEDMGKSWWLSCTSTERRSSKNTIPCAKTSGKRWKTSSRT